MITVCATCVVVVVVADFVVGFLANMASMEKLLLNSISQTLFTIVLITVIMFFSFLLREHTHERVNCELLAVHEMKRSSILTLLGCQPHYLYASASESLTRLRSLTHTQRTHERAQAKAQAKAQADMHTYTRTARERRHSHRKPSTRNHPHCAEYERERESV